MGSRGSSSLQSRGLNPEYARAVETAKRKIKSEQKESIEQTRRIVNAVKDKNDGIKKYAKQNAEWKAKVQESAMLARQGKFKESDKAYQEGKKIYESIPKDFRID